MASSSDRQVPVLATGGRGRFAYAFYATSNTHAMAVLVAVRRLQQLGIPPDTDLVVLAYRVWSGLRRSLQDLGVFVVRASPPALVPHRYFRESLLKLRVFQLVQYERVVFLDADSLPWSNLSTLLEAAIEEPVAMPATYWTRERRGTSALMTIRPSAENWGHLQSWLEDAVKQGGAVDMDGVTLNKAFAGRIHYLPPEHLRLNSDWTRGGIVAFRGRLGLSPDDLHVLHFSDLGKPWFYPPRVVRWLRPGARKQYHEFWDIWWRMRDEVIRGSRGAARVQLLVLKYGHIVLQPLRAVARTGRRAVLRSVRALRRGGV